MVAKVRSDGTGWAIEVFKNGCKKNQNAGEFLEMVGRSTLILFTSLAAAVAFSPSSPFFPNTRHVAMSGERYIIAVEI